MSEQEDNDIKIAKALARHKPVELTDAADAKEMQDTWFLTGLNAGKRLDAKAALSKVHQQMDSSADKTSFPYLAIAAAITLIIAASVAFWWIQKDQDTPAIAENLPTKSTNEVFETTEKTSDYRLPDGSDVSLNKFSSLNYKKDDPEKREVELVGEAFFAVQHDVAHPFVVMTSDLRIEVLGTQFNVKAYPGQPTIVTVKEGKVKTTLLEKNEILILTAEDQIVNEPDQPKTTSQKVDNANYLAWKTGLLEFKDSELPEVAARLEELYNITIKYPEKLSTCKLTAQFDNRDLEFIFKVLEATLKIDVIREGNQYTFTGDGC